ncbi:MAG: Cytochrome oxidase, cbb3-type, subunit [Pseudomonadota bacterium]|jgi:cytochrome c553
MTGAPKVHAKFCFSAFVFLLSACTSYDYGSTGDFYYEVPDPENPLWNEGISELVEKKCATCHTSANPWYKPQNVPELANAQNPAFGLNFISQEAFFDGLNSLLPLVKKCIESTCGKDNIPMPPNYATPLNASEKKALLAYITPKLPVVASNLSDSFKSSCGGCHGSDGKSGYAPKLGTTPYTLDAFKDVITKGKGTMGAQPGYDLTKAEADHSIIFK